MTRIKKGNAFAHAKQGGQRVTFKNATVKKKPAAKRAPVKRAAPKAKPEYRYAVQVRKTAASIWQKLVGSNDLENAKQLAQLYAKRYPRYAFRVL